MTFWQKSSEKCELLGLSAVLAESEILFKHIFMQNSNQSTTLDDLMSIRS